MFVNVCSLMVLNIQPDDGTNAFIIADSGSLYYPFNSCLRPGELLAYTSDGIPYCGAWYVHSLSLSAVCSTLLLLCSALLCSALTSHFRSLYGVMCDCLLWGLG